MVAFGAGSFVKQIRAGDIGVFFRFAHDFTCGAGLRPCRRALYFYTFALPYRHSTARRFVEEFDAEFLQFCPQAVHVETKIARPQTFPVFLFFDAPLIA